ncbi:hypothetical protein TMatcc_003168 [Talaromyces marneffei ATCC 18224]|uniref:Uncharacterized protein n=1 Tax=Talaromyces marneffei (strain ATCC 18224 / CBS 334.59 / QM 7333) TaxID=441960 RepID=B6Q5W4_TALMQ|nr:uncharacterized protein EYB26_001786 [Talaromyces marneffei]EEA28503.1 hypothetical protein PMAA_033100 [Talaromyces marneffei ATCC 18224]KAE8555871.1 hypothetical protein EYB25_000569 [Talaromyces marneffei]QGA14133.1 hypothetical protein EYB26_001786 [Talaromyces marneffei]
MDIIWIVILLFVLPLLAMLAWFALSSCLGDGLRNRIRGARRSGRGSYGPEYLRTMTFTGPAMSEQIELDDMYREEQYEEERAR